ncbi:MAG: PAS domain S-box protein [Acidobacteriia bacterium]|nr:PAS domain S-box protein [Terriglobia bacterium]
MLFASADQACAQELRRMLLENDGWRYAIEQSAELPVILERLKQGTIDVLLLDLSCPCNPGIEMIAQLRAQGKDVPIVALMPQGKEELARASLRAGVQEYLGRETLNGADLARALQFAIERKQAEQVLRDRESSFHSLFAGNPLPMWLYDVETLRFLEVNEAAISQYGYTEEEFLAMRIADIRPAEDLPRLRKYIDSPRENYRHAGEWRHRLKSGRIIDVDITSHAIEIAGRPAVLVVARDVTREKGTLSALREAEEKYREIFDNAVVGIFQTTPEGRYLSANQALARMYGFDSPAELMTAWTDIANQVYVEPARRKELQRLLHEEGIARNFQIQFKRKDGSHGWILENSRVVRDAAGKVICYEGTQQDITERKRVEAALLASESQHRELIENAVYGIFVSELAGRFVDVNPALVAMLGYSSKEELLALDPGTDVYRRVEDRQRIIAQIKETKVLQGVEVEWKRRDGTSIAVRLSGRVVEDEKGEAQRAEVIVENVTEARKLEQQLRQAQKMEAIGRLAGGVAHDFNNLLAVMIGHCELITAQMSAEDPLRRQIEVISKAGNRAAELTHQLLAFSRQQVLQPRILNLNDVIEDTQKMLPRLLGAHIELSALLDSSLGQIKADPGQIEMVLLNLAVNARDAMPQGGRLTIATSNVDFAAHPPPPCTGMKPGPYVLLEVLDTGSGMDAATQSRIFEPFYTTKDVGKGTGLGLATVEGIVSQSGGFIAVESELSRGTAFHIYLPRIDDTRKAKTPAAASPRTPRGSETILLVEDSEPLRLLTREFLVRQGYTVLDVGSAPAAIQIAAEHRGAIPLLITDVVMPQMNGPALAHILTRARQEMKVLYVSGYGSESTGSVERLKTSQAFLQKPYAMSALAGKIRELLDGSAS